jgi:FkbM family methyltransferase
MIADLIYDVGMNDGDDTAYYLHEGYRVVAVEVDPTLIEQARERFAGPIREGRLELVQAAIGPRRETAQFWICEGKSVWNSFDRQIASREGHSCHSIDVESRPFRDLLEQYGVPFYLKVDIEGHDTYCITDLDQRDLPKYVSLEMGRQLDPLFMLRDLGYSRFKLITQNDHSQMAIDPFSVSQLVKERLRPYPSLYRLGRRVAGLAKRLSPSSPPPVGHGVNGSHWTFALGSSGPFGEDTAGSWQTFDEAAFTWLTYQLGRSSYGQPSLWVWHDLHAVRAESS